MVEAYIEKYIDQMLKQMEAKLPEIVDRAVQSAFEKRGWSEPKSVKKPIMTREEFFALDDDCILDDYPERAEQSKLNKLGYSVSRNSGMTEKARQNLLQHIIETGLMKKWEVISHLQYLLKINGKKADNEYAAQRWQRDLEFVKKL